MENKRVSFGPKSWLFPMPVLVVGTYDGQGNPDAMTAAWGGMHDTCQIGMCLSANHQTVVNLLGHAVVIGVRQLSQITGC